ncbi:MAG: zinc-binding dehydrogenase [Alphaproteobacteria bacterium]|nr:zinc-binding dehydrogenase [Alphaproteobacteria bacterium]
MRAAVLTGLRTIQLRDIPSPTPRNDEVRVRVAAVGVCGSDLHSYLEGSTTGPQAVQPLVLGHEFAGVITPDIADRVGMKAGTIVAVDPAQPCGVCEWCERGHTNLCPDVRFLGYAPNNGAMAEYVSVPPDALHALPTGMDAADGVLLETLGVALHALDLAKLRLGETVAVLGCGPVGLLAVQLARTAGAARVLAVDPLAYRHRLATTMGADAGFASFTEIAAATGKRGVDLVIEATDSEHGFDQATRMARIGGRLVMIGIPTGNRYTIAASEARRRGLTVKFSRRMPEIYPRAIALAAAGRVDMRPLATHRFALEDTPRAFAMQAAHEDGIIKAIIQP